MKAYERGLEALGDGTRRAIFDLLTGGPRSVGELADRLPVSRPAVSQHLRTLALAGLVLSKPDGARRVYALDPTALAELRDHFDRLRGRALAGLEAPRRSRS